MTMSGLRPAQRIIVNIGDALFCVLILAWLHAWLIGGARVSLLVITISTRDTSRVLVEALAIGLLRHWLVPSPSLRSRIEAAAREFASLPRTKEAVQGIDGLSRSKLVMGVVVVTRLLVLMAGILAVNMFPLTGDPYRDPNINATKLAPVATLNERWDAGWYTQIALEGYTWEAEQARTKQQVAAFFPGFPLVVRGGLFVTDRVPLSPSLTARLGRNPVAQAVVVGTVVSLVAFTIALVLLHQLAALDLRPPGANRTVVLCAVYPFAIFFSAPYTESLYLMSVVGAFLAQRRGQAWWLVIFGFLAGVTRQTGFLLSVALVVACATLPATAVTRRWNFGSIVGALSPLLGVAAHSGYLWWRFGDPLAWFYAQQAWVPPDRWSHLGLAVSGSGYLQAYPYEAINLLAILAVLPMVWKSRRIQWSYFVFGLTSVAVPLMANIVPLGRMTSVVFPVFIALAMAPIRQRAFVTIAAVWLCLQLAVATQFYGWRPLY